MCLVGSHPSKMDESKAATWIKLGLLSESDMATISGLACLGVPVRKQTSKASKFLGRKLREPRGKDVRKVSISPCPGKFACRAHSAQRQLDQLQPWKLCVMWVACASVLICQGSGLTVAEVQAKTAGEGEEPVYELERFVPMLQEVLEDHIAGALKQDEFPYVNPPAETGAAAPHCHLPGHQPCAGIGT